MWIRMVITRPETAGQVSLQPQSSLGNSPKMYCQKMLLSVTKQAVEPTRAPSRNLVVIGEDQEECGVPTKRVAAMP